MASIQEQLAAKRLEKSHKPIKVPVPGWAEDCLVAVYRPMDDWATTRGVATGETPEEEAEAAADALVDCCTAVEARDDDGAWQTLPSTLGKALADELAVAGAEDLCDKEGKPIAGSDREAVFLLMGGTSDTMAHYLAVKARSLARRREVDEELAGESPAS